MRIVPRYWKLKPIKVGFCDRCGHLRPLWRGLCVEHNSFSDPRATHVPGYYHHMRLARHSHA